MKRLLVFSFLLVYFMSNAQRPGSLDASFNSGPEFWGTIYSSCVQPDGKVIIAGDFKRSDYSRGIARLNSNGTVDIAFNAAGSFDSSATAVALQSNGSILLGGNFSHFGNISAHGIARVKSDGTIDNNFHTGSGFNGLIKCITVQPDAPACRKFFRSEAGQWVQTH